MNAEQWFREHGPVTVEDAEYKPTTTTLRMAGIRRLRPKWGGSVSTVYYFPDEHSKVDVLEAFPRKTHDGKSFQREKSL